MAWAARLAGRRTVRFTSSAYTCNTCGKSTPRNSIVPAGIISSGEGLATCRVGGMAMVWSPVASAELGTAMLLVRTGGTGRETPRKRGGTPDALVANGV